MKFFGLIGFALALAGAIFFYIHHFHLNEKRDVSPYGNLELFEKQGVPDFQVLNLEGKKENLSDFKAPLILVNLWASWCGPCVKEYPSMIRLVEKMDGKLKILAIAMDENKKEVNEFLEIYGFGGSNMHHFWDPKYEVAQLLGTEKLPETYILDSSYKLIRKVPSSEEWDSERVISYFEQLLDGNGI